MNDKGKPRLAKFYDYHVSFSKPFTLQTRTKRLKLFLWIFWFFLKINYFLKCKVSPQRSSKSWFENYMEVVFTFDFLLSFVLDCQIIFVSGSIKIGSWSLFFCQLWIVRLNLGNLFSFVVWYLKNVLFLIYNCAIRPSLCAFRVRGECRIYSTSIVSGNWSIVL